MNIEELLLPEEKKKIKSITEEQKFILERREALKIILNGGSVEKKEFSKVNKKSNLDNTIAYRFFLEKEGFFKEKKVEKNIKRNLIDSDEVNKVFKNISGEVYNKTYGIYGELMNGLSSINKIEKIISGLGSMEKKLVLCRECKDLDYSKKERYKSLIYNLSRLIKLLSDSKGDIVDYYSNKADILKQLKTIVNISKNLFNTL